MTPETQEAVQATLNVLKAGDGTRRHGELLERVIRDLTAERDEARAEADRHLEHLRAAHPTHFTPNVLGERMCGCGGQWPCPAERDELEKARAALDRVRELLKRWGSDRAVAAALVVELHLTLDGSGT